MTRTMATIKILTRLLWCWLVLLQVGLGRCAEQDVLGLDLDIRIPDKNNKDHNYYRDLAHDPSRTYVAVYTLRRNDTLAYLDTVHAAPDGVFHLSLPKTPLSDYQLVFQSLDVLFAVSSQFRVHVAPDTGSVSIHQYLPGVHSTLQSKLPFVTATGPSSSAAAAATLDGALFHISLNQYLQQDAAGMAASAIRSIPFLSTILASRWMTIGFVSVVIVAVLPAVITRLDPDFADRLVEAQQQQQQQQQEEKTSQ